MVSDIVAIVIPIVCTISNDSTNIFKIDQNWLFVSIEKTLWIQTLSEKVRLTP